MKKKLVILTLCGMVVTSALAGGMATQTFATETDGTPMVIATLDNQNQIPSPWKDYESLKDAQDAAGFKVKLPKKISGYKKSVIQAIDKEMLQVFYEKGDAEILIRKAPEAQGKDISGDNNEYAKVSKVKKNGKTITIKGTAKKKNLAIWSDGDYSYSVSSSKGLSQKALLKIVKQVQ